MHFDRVIVGGVVTLGLIIAALSLVAVRLGPSVDTVVFNSTFDGVSVNSQIAVTFSEPMKSATVNAHFHLSPSVKGDFSWVGNEVIFSPRHALAYGRHYQLTIDSAARDTSGKRLAHSFHRAFTTQSQHLLYIGGNGIEKNNLVLASTTGHRLVLGGGAGLVSDYSVSPDRSLAVYVRRGQIVERADELWLLSLSDSSTQRVFRKPDWTLSQPHFSPDGRYVVFLATNVRLCRKYYGCFRDTSGPVVELLDLRSRKVRPFHSASDVPITNFIDFSPAGQIAFTDLGSALTLALPDGSHVLHVPNRGNSLEFQGFDASGDKAAFVGQTPSSTGGDVLIYAGGRYIDISRGIYDSSVPAFSSSGNAVAYAAYIGERGIEPVYGLNTYDFKTKATAYVTHERLWSDWTPSWSPDDQYIAFVRSRPQEAMYMGSGQIWIARADGSRQRELDVSGRDPHWAQ